MTEQFHIDKVEPLPNVGMVPPIDFPRIPYTNIFNHIYDIQGLPQNRIREFGSAWNAIAYRFQAMTESDEAFTNSIVSVGAVPGHPNRYIQERELFSFFCEGLAVLETYSYGIHALASILSPIIFPFSTIQDYRGVSPKSTLFRFEKAFPDILISTNMRRVFKSSEFEQWSNIRNILVHRSLPGRTHFMGGENDGQTLWISDISLDHSTKGCRRQWLSENLGLLLDATFSFLLQNISLEYKYVPLESESNHT